MTTKDTIISLLADGDFISGEELAEKCQVSRAAVHKAVTALRNQGYIIEAVTNKGYRLKESADTLDGSRMERAINSSISSSQVSVKLFDTIDSTMLEAKRLTADKKIHNTVIVTDQQTAGRGRMGRPFISPKNTGIYFSLIYSPEGGVKNPAVYTAAAAVSVARAVKKLYGAECKIKWVNDVFLDGKKICGILTEGVANFETGRIETAVVGIGINVRNSEFPPEIADVAGCIENTPGISQNRVSRNELVAEVISDLIKVYDGYSSGNQNVTMEMIEEYRNRSLLKGLSVEVNPVAGLSGEPYEAKVLDISPEAELVVQLKDGTVKKLFSGEVSLKSSLFTR